MGWNDPVVGSTILRRPAIQSPGYVKGSTGWAINSDGTAEFNSLTLRGTLTIQSSGQGLFVYSGTPALGNLILSIAAVGGTDAYGNQYPQGLGGFSNSGTFTSIGTINTKYVEIQSDTTSQNIDFSPDLNTWNAGSIITQSANGHLTLTAPQLKLDGGAGVVLDLAPASPAGGGNATFTLTADVIRVTNAVSATQPGTSSLETWHALPYAAQWTDAGVQAGAYRLDATGRVVLRGRGRFTSNGTTGLANPTTLCTLPSGYRPSGSQGWPVPVYQSPTIASNRIPSLVVDATGVAKIFNVTSAVTNGTQVDVDFTGGYWP